ncbi:MAG: hypothetical protein JXA67_14710, partial [Micromonosporaceae bacterium]|nr:hypothetical protein [Micromonosporaceae bacterium]
ALAVDPGDTLALLLEIGALQNQDLSIVRRTREALGPAYDRASDRKDWEQTHTVGILQQALAAPDSAAYLAYQARGLSPGEATDRFAHALAIVGCAADSLGYPRRPWEIEPNDLGLPHWREQIWRLLLDTPGNALPQPSACACNEPGSPKALAGEHTGWCRAAGNGGAP